MLFYGISAPPVRDCCPVGFRCRHHQPSAPGRASAIRHSRLLFLAVPALAVAQSTTRISLDSAGSQANGASALASISADGRFIAFSSDATGLVSDDENGVEDVFIRDRAEETVDGTILLSGPVFKQAGTAIQFEWFAAPPDSTYQLMYSLSLGGMVLQGHSFDLAEPAVGLATGQNDGDGRGTWTSGPTPASAAGWTVHFEVSARDGSGQYYDSNAMPVLFY
ncbi:MAG: hypothetical protein H8E31_06550 [Planctomycetes bacterium]|nr:hypothetical protein [Planctomycetota bacterium]